MRNMLLIGAVIVIVLLSIAIIAFIYGSGKAPGEKKEFAVGETVFMVDVVDNMASRAKGLSGREPLGEKEGMVFLFGTSTSQSFWMEGMKFALDMVWIRGGKVVDITKNVPPPSPGQNSFTLPQYSPKEPADTVLEVLAGTSDRFGLKIGDTAGFR